MSLHSRTLSAGRLWGVIVTFEQAGDCLKWHTHTPANAHVTIVARGRVIMETGTPNAAAGYDVSHTYELAEGHCIDTEAGIYHQFVAMTDNARIFNLAKEPKDI